jgi:hypothetical protein
MRREGGTGVAGSQPMSTAVHRSPNKLWRSNSIFNLPEALQESGVHGHDVLGEHAHCRVLVLQLSAPPTTPATQDMRIL